MIYKTIYYAFISDKLNTSELLQTEIVALKTLNQTLFDKKPAYSQTNHTSFLDLWTSLKKLQIYYPGPKTGRYGCAFLENFINDGDLKMDQTAFAHGKLPALNLFPYRMRNCELCTSKSNYIYDFQRKICRFCPFDYRNCKSIINQTILVDCEGGTQMQDPLIKVVNNLQDLRVFIASYVSEEAIFIFNEFFLEELHLNILFKAETQCVVTDELFTKLRYWDADNEYFLTPTFLDYLVSSISHVSLKIGIYSYSNNSINESTYQEYFGNDKQAEIIIYNISGLHFTNITSLEIRNIIINMRVGGMALHIHQIQNILLENLEIKTANASLNQITQNTTLDNYLLVNPLITLSNCSSIEINGLTIEEEIFDFLTSLIEIFNSSCSKMSQISFSGIHDFGVTNNGNCNVFSIVNSTIQMTNITINNSKINSSSLRNIFFCLNSFVNVSNVLNKNIFFGNLIYFKDNNNDNYYYVNIINITFLECQFLGTEIQPISVFSISIVEGHIYSILILNSIFNYVTLFNSLINGNYSSQGDVLEISFLYVDSSSFFMTLFVSIRTNKFLSLSNIFINFI